MLDILIGNQKGNRALEEIRIQEVTIYICHLDCDRGFRL